MTVDSEILIATAAKNAITHGIDANGLIVASGTTPAYGGSSSGEDFYVYSSSGGTLSGGPINLYAWQVDTTDGVDDKDFEDVPEKPCIEINVEANVASSALLGREVMGCTITWLISLGDNQGVVNYGGSSYSNERACMILRNRLMEVVQRLAFTDIEEMGRGDAEPMRIGNPLPDDNTTFSSGVSMYLEYVPEI